MINVVLVHDAWHGAWSWKGVIELLEDAGESRGIGRIIAPDLPGHGHRLFDEIRRITQDHYVNAVVTPVQVNRLTDVVLVGHGFAGTFLPQVALELGDVVRRVVFIAGLLPPEGKEAYDTLSFPMKLLIQRNRPTENGVTLPTFVFRRMLCNHLSKSQTEELLSRLAPDPYLPWRVPISRQSFVGRFPTTYLALTHDRSIPLGDQRLYCRSLEASEVVDVDGGHEILLSDPAKISQLLLESV